MNSTEKALELAQRLKWLKVEGKVTSFAIDYEASEIHGAPTFTVVCATEDGTQISNSEIRTITNAVEVIEGRPTFCHNCKRGGDSARLWGRLIYRVGKEWRPILNEVTGGIALC